jgi:hypothetical protein
MRRSRSLSTFAVFDGGPYTRGRVSHLFGGTLEFLANNHFHLLPPLAKRVEMCGSWLPFIAGQVLDVLYQKTLVLTWLRAASGNAAGWKSPRPW